MWCWPTQNLLAIHLFQAYSMQAQRWSFGSNWCLLCASQRVSLLMVHSSQARDSRYFIGNPVEAVFELPIYNVPCSRRAFTICMDIKYKFPYTICPLPCCIQSASMKELRAVCIYHKNKKKTQKMKARRNGAKDFAPFISCLRGIQVKAWCLTMHQLHTCTQIQLAFISMWWD